MVRDPDLSALVDHGWLMTGPVVCRSRGMEPCRFHENIARLWLQKRALSRNSTGGLFYGPFAGFTAFSIFAALASVRAASSPDPRMATATSMRLCPIRSE